MGVGLAARGGAACVLGLAIRRRGSPIVQLAVSRELAALVARLRLHPLRAVGLWTRAHRGRLPGVDSASALTVMESARALAGTISASRYRKRYCFWLLLCWL